MKKNMTFEEAYRKLEETVRRMEDKQLPLDEMMKLYSEASELVLYCRKKLEDAKTEITTIDEKIAAMSGESFSFVED